MGGIAANGPPAIVALPPEIDCVNAGQAYAKLRAAFTAGAAVVVADLTATTFCDSAGIQHLLMAHNDAATAGAQLRLAISPGGSVARVVQLLGVDQLVAVYATTDDAAAGMNSPAGDSPRPAPRPGQPRRLDV